MDESAAALSAGGIGGFAMTFVFCMKKILPYSRRNVNFYLVGTFQFSLAPFQHNFAPNGISRSGTTHWQTGDAGGELAEGIYGSLLLYSTKMNSDACLFIHRRRIFNPIH